MEKRKWCYVQSPMVYGIECDLCNGSHIAWSEFEHMIWCFKCERDTKGTAGIFGGPIPIGAAQMMGIRFDRVNLKTGEIEKFEH